MSGEFSRGGLMLPWSSDFPFDSDRRALTRRRKGQRGLAAAHEFEIDAGQ